MPVYMELGSVLSGDRIYAEGRRIEKPRQIREEHGKENKLFKSTVLSGAAYCVIEKPLRAI